MGRVKNDFIEYMKCNKEKFQLKGKQKGYSDKVIAIILCILINSLFFDDKTNSKGCLTFRKIYEIMKRYKEFYMWNCGNNCRVPNERYVDRVLEEFEFFDKNKKPVFNARYKKVIKTCDWRVNEEKLKKFISYDGDIYNEITDIKERLTNVENKIDELFELLNSN